MGLAWCLGGGNLKEKKDHQVRCPKAHSYPKLPASTLKRNLAWMVREDGSKGFHGNQKISHPKVVLHPSASEGSLHQPVRCVCGEVGAESMPRHLGKSPVDPGPRMPLLPAASHSDTLVGPQRSSSSPLTTAPQVSFHPGSRA